MIVSGPPASGKTTLARRLARDLALPLLCRDDLKECLFDTLGWSDRAWSRTLGGASYGLLYHALGVLLQTGSSCIAESNFDRTHDSARLSMLVQQHGYATMQVLCRAAPAVIVARFQQRVASGARHPGHVDHFEAATLDPAQVQGFSAPLNLAGPLLDVDTTTFEDAGYSELLGRVRSAIE